MTEWFNSRKNTNTPFGERYLEEFELKGERTAREVDSIEQIIKESFDLMPKVLDMAGGFGRIGKQLLSRGLTASLVDLDLNLKLLSMAQQTGVNLVVGGDLRRLPFKDKSFDLALLMFTSFGYFSDKSEDEYVVKEAYRILNNGGIFLIDLSNFHKVIKNFSPSRILHLKSGETIEYTKRIENGVLIEERVLLNSNGESTPLSPIKLRIYFDDEIQTICTSMSFKEIKVTDEKLNPFDPSISRRLWVMCKK